MKVFAGSSGFSYKEWVGSFYPEDVKSKDWLSYYSKQLSCVEINNTFYRLPKVEMLEKWKDTVPSSFTFSLKASRRITHSSRLNPETCHEALQYFCQAAEVLGGNLGPLLFQLPPNAKLNLERLQGFLKLLPAEIRPAFEFRHPSWHVPAVWSELEKRNAAMVVMDDENGCLAMSGDAIAKTSDWAYLRLRKNNYSDEELAMWIELCEDAGFNDSYFFFKHEDEGRAPILAKQLLEL